LQSPFAIPIALRWNPGGAMLRVHPWRSPATVSKATPESTPRIFFI
jgi:hypothetical protein